MTTITYSKLLDRYGLAMADQCLMEIEKAARIFSPAVYGVDPETRLANAIRIQDSANDNQSSWLA